MATEPSLLADDELWPQTAFRPRPAPTIALRFRETELIREGGWRPDLDGEYRAIANARRMVGVWVSKGRLVGCFEMEKQRG